MKLILDLVTVEPVTGSVADPDSGIAVPIAGWMSLMSAITNLAGKTTPPTVERAIEGHREHPP